MRRLLGFSGQRKVLGIGTFERMLLAVRFNVVQKLVPLSALLPTASKLLCSPRRCILGSWTYATFRRTGHACEKIRSRLTVCTFKAKGFKVLLGGVCSAKVYLLTVVQNGDLVEKLQEVMSILCSSRGWDHAYLVRGLGALVDGD